MNGDSENGNKSEMEKRSLSAPAELFEAADKAMKRRMMTNFSEYVRALIREDLDGADRKEPNPELETTSP